MDAINKKAIYMLGFFHREIFPVTKLILSDIGINESHTEVLKAITPLRAAIKRLFPAKDARLYVKKLDQIYDYVQYIKYKAKDQDEADAYFNTIQDLCIEIEQAAKEYADSSFNKDEYFLFKCGLLVSFWYELEKPPYKLSRTDYSAFIEALKACGLQSAVNKVAEVDSIPNENFDFKHSREVWNIHNLIINELDKQMLAIAQPNANSSEILKNKLTNLPTLEQLEQDLEVLELNLRHPFSIAFLDIDNFKQLNTDLGHDTADEVIKQLAKSLDEYIADRGTVYHRSGDEFIITLKNTTSEEAHLLLTRCVNEVKTRTFQTSKGIRQITISCGIASYPEHGSEMKDIREKSNQAMQTAKNNGKSRAYVWIK